MPNKKIRLVFDSRGHTLKPKINSKLQSLNCKYCIQYTIESGGTIESTTSSCIDDIRMDPSDVVLNFSGVNNLSIKNTNHISPAFMCPETLAECLYSSYNCSKIAMRNYTKKAVYGELTGLDLDMYNWKRFRIVTYYHRYEQSVINDGIPRLNGKLYCLNENTNIIAPRTSSLVHEFSNNKYSANYDHLHDGVHALPETSDFWANEIAEAIVKQI